MTDFHRNHLEKQEREFGIPKETLGTYANYARGNLESYLKNRLIYLEVEDEALRDRYDRILAYIYTKSSKDWIGQWVNGNGERFHNINERMLMDGYAFPYFCKKSPYWSYLENAFKFAFEGRSGIWGRISKSQFVDLNRILIAIQKSS